MWIVCVCVWIIFLSPMLEPYATLPNLERTEIIMITWYFLLQLHLCQKSIAKLCGYVYVHMRETEWEREEHKRLWKKADSKCVFVEQWDIAAD